MLIFNLVKPIIIHEPRLSLTMAGHPEAWMVMLHELKTTHGDGFLHRFLFHAPPIPTLARFPKEIQNQAKPCSISCLYYTVAELCKNKTKYVLSNEARDFFDEKNE
jgi:hypothetical protein